MKQNILYILLGIFLLASCQQEELPGEESRYGYLSLKSVVAEVENVNAPASRARKEKRKSFHTLPGKKFRHRSSFL